MLLYLKYFFVGILSSKVLNAAGKELQSECSKAENRANQYIRVTKGYNLPCRNVVHVITTDDEKLLSSRIAQALEQAEKLEATSVALPTLGAGKLFQSCTCFL